MVFVIEIAIHGVSEEVKEGEVIDEAGGAGLSKAL